MRLPPGGGSSAGDRGVGVAVLVGRSALLLPHPSRFTLHPSPVTLRTVPSAPQLPGTGSTVDQAAG